MAAVRDTTVGGTRGLTAEATQRPSASTAPEPLQALLGLAKALIGDAEVTEAEQQLLQTVPACEDAAQLQTLTEAIRHGDDPLGALFCGCSTPPPAARKARPSRPRPWCRAW